LKIADAKKSGDKCDKIHKLPPQFKLKDEDECKAVDSESICNTAQQCVWCKSTSANSICSQLTDVPNLPKSLFQCDTKVLAAKKDDKDDFVWFEGSKIYKDHIVSPPMTWLER